MPVKLFVGGLSFSTSTERLRETFSRYGSVGSAMVMTDRETGRSRGFGFVEMATPEEAEQAITALNGASVDGRTIRVDKATPRGSAPVRTGGPGRFGGPRPGGPGGPERRPFGSGSGERRPAFGGPGGPGGPGRGFTPAADQPRGGRGGPRRGSGGDVGRGQGKSGNEPRRASRRSPGMQRRSNDRGRRSLGDEGTYRGGY